MYELLYIFIKKKKNIFKLLYRITNKLAVHACGVYLFSIIYRLIYNNW